MTGLRSQLPAGNGFRESGGPGVLRRLGVSSGMTEKDSSVLSVAAFRDACH